MKEKKEYFTDPTILKEVRVAGETMISKKSPVVKEFVTKLFKATHNENYTAGSLASIKSEENMKLIIQYIDDHPGASISEIEEYRLRMNDWQP